MRNSKVVKYNDLIKILRKLKQEDKIKELNENGELSEKRDYVITYKKNVFYILARDNHSVEIKELYNFKGTEEREKEFIDILENMVEEI
ncbi:hypothetical protein QTH09_02980 [Clostridium perfringens]|uniref:hypothetical protein n=1 Tax=Clostridium perfringens TaxID=1502 RepID=UPI001CB59532|nr:hypothetical protein [Clostridium perfringens]MCX0399589.1 hypothetical protein [Clostridium perfringens]MDM0609996.1 hypothetical protein [Clostridium perfringens]STB11370.1 Uncharacterised protein [Clostridium novyi]